MVAGGACGECTVKSPCTEQEERQSSARGRLVVVVHFTQLIHSVPYYLLLSDNAIKVSALFVQWWVHVMLCPC